MPRIVTTLEFAKTAKDRTWQMMTRVYEQLARVVNGNITIANGWNTMMVDPTNPTAPLHSIANPKNSDNVRGAVVYVTFVSPDVDHFIHHNLGYIPRCYIPLWKSLPCDIYDGAGVPSNPPGLGLNLEDAQTTPEGTNPATTATTQMIPLRSTAACDVLLFIF